MKTIAIAIATALTAIAPAALADHPSEPRYSSTYEDRYLVQRSDERYYGTDRSYSGERRFARVLASEPVYASSREECWNPRAGRYEERRDGGTSIGKGAAIGALAGGVLGHQVDKGEGTAAGAIIGGLLGHQLQKRSDRQDDLDMSNCRVLSDASNVIGYQVRYRYRGDEYVTRLPSDPGERLVLGEDIRSDGTPFPVG